MQCPTKIDLFENDESVVDDHAMNQLENTIVWLKVVVVVLLLLVVSIDDDVEIEVVTMENFDNVSAERSMAVMAMNFDDIFEMMMNVDYENVKMMTMR